MELFVLSFFVSAVVLSVAAVPAHPATRKTVARAKKERTRADLNSFCFIIPPLMQKMCRCLREVAIDLVASSCDQHRCCVAVRLVPQLGLYCAVSGTALAEHEKPSRLRDLRIGSCLGEQRDFTGIASTWCSHYCRSPSISLAVHSYDSSLHALELVSSSTSRCVSCSDRGKEC
jgi:hypothetical protein